jgi:arabinan endo-1,5-alpha-L-arabinosidase
MKSILKHTFFGGAVLLVLALIAPACRTHSPAQASEAPRFLELSGDLGVHDPCIIKEKDVYYIFCTGGGRRGIIPMRTSTNLQSWTARGNTLASIPQWGAVEIPRARDAWAPDISYFNGKYHLYYSLSSFGVNESAIGLAVNETLDPADSRYQWADQGLVVRSKTGVDDFNAIDPNLVIEDKNNIWLCWGSFWGGIKMRRVDPATGKLSATDTNLYSLASRPRLAAPQTPPVEGAVEAPTIIRRGKFWYLFASYDFCCRGIDSTYTVKVGRASKVTGPYVDREGRLLTEDGGTIVVPAITARWHGAGHQAVLRDSGKDYLVFHAYDPNNGRPRLEISTMSWEDGWPRIAAP